ncbi:MAG: Hint domain-containing protein [Pseudomonadota bacterium]
MAENTSDQPATSGDDTLTGTGAADSFSGGSGNDSITTGAGDDIISGDDPLFGQLAFRIFNTPSLQSVSQIDTLGTEVADGFVTDFEEEGLTQTIRDATGDQNNFGLIYNGTLNITQPGDYVFQIVSDDGLSVTVGGQTAVIDDGPHAPRTETGDPITLASGEQPIEIRYFENGGREALEVRVQLPGTSGFVDLFDSGLLAIPPGDSGVPGDDVIDAGAGSDVITTGDGNDTIVANSFGAGDNDTITDFDPGADVADLTGQFSDIADLKAAASAGTDGVTVTLPGGGSVLFEGLTDVDQLTVDNTLVPCFVTGTLIETDRGDTPVENLRAGDLVLTRDHGLRPLRWAGRRRIALAGQPSLCPILIPAGALGGGLPRRDLTVSPQHRMLLSDWRADLMFGVAEVLVAAKALTMLEPVRMTKPAEVTYHHIMFERHEIIRAEGSWSESFHLGPLSLGAFGADTRAELEVLFPELVCNEGIAHGPLARKALKSWESGVLLRRSRPGQAR